MRHGKILAPRGGGIGTFGGLRWFEEGAKGSDWWADYQGEQLIKSFYTAKFLSAYRCDECKAFLFYLDEPLEDSSNKP